MSNIKKIYDTIDFIKLNFTNNNNDAEIAAGTKYINKYQRPIIKQIDILFIPKSVVYIDYDAFKDVKIKKLIFEKNSKIDYINEHAFYNYNLKEVEFNNNINKDNYKRIINNTAFDGNNEIKNLLNSLNKTN
jgi:hypothetical protein